MELLSSKVFMLLALFVAIGGATIFITESLGAFDIDTPASLTVLGSAQNRSFTGLDDNFNLMRQKIDNTTTDLDREELQYDPYSLIVNSIFGAVKVVLEIPIAFLTMIGAMLTIIPGVDSGTGVFIGAIIVIAIGIYIIFKIMELVLKREV